jgi:hypothetical protein
MAKMKILSALAAAFFLVGLAPAEAQSCFASSKTYRVVRLQGGGETHDGWAVQGGDFAQCVHRGEAAEKTLRGRYPETLYELLPAATIGCHSPCG